METKTTSWRQRPEGVDKDQKVETKTRRRKDQKVETKARRRRQRPEGGDKRLEGGDKE